MKKEGKSKKGKSGKKGTKGKKAKETKKGSTVKKKKKTTTRKKSSKIKKEKKPKVVKKVEESGSYEDIDYENFGKPDDIGSLDIIEYLKLIRNCLVLLAVIGAIVFFLKKSLMASDEIDLVVIFSAILFSLIAFLLFVLLVKFMLEIKEGKVYVYNGYIQKTYDDVLYSSYLPFCTILLKRMIHHIGVHHYLRIKDNDFVIIRRTPVTRCIVNFIIVREGKQ